MKKKYLIPETEVDFVSHEGNFLATGEDLTGRTYGSSEGEDEDGFWE